MSKRHAAVAVGLAAGCLFAGTAQAADTIAVTVSATVNGVCKFSSGQTPTVTIANAGSEIDPSVTTTATGSTNINYKCTAGTGPTFTVPTTATLNCTTSGTCGSTSMAATMSSTNAGAGAGFTTDKVLTVTGTIASGVFQLAQAGTYSGQITVSVSP